MAYSRPTFEIQGVTFQLRPTSPRNVKALSNYIDDSDIADPNDEDTDPLMELADQYYDVLDLIAEPQDGSLSDIEAMDLDINLVDHYLEVFMPAGTVT